MKFKIDENLPLELAAEILSAGHEADTVRDEGLAGRTDEVLLAHVQREGRAILTMDKGIADIRVYPPQDYAGIVLLRLPSADRVEIIAFVRQHLPALLQLDLAGRLVVVSETGIRTR